MRWLQSISLGILCICAAWTGAMLEFHNAMTNMIVVRFDTRHAYGPFFGDCLIDNVTHSAYCAVDKRP